jgi:anti-sigma factor RsiW
MTTESGHLGEELQDLLDGRLGPADRERAERHLRDCAECRGERDALSRVKQAVRASRDANEVPAHVASGVAAALDHEEQKTAAATERRSAGLRQRSPFFGYAAVAAAVAALVLLAVFVAGRRNLPSRVALDYQNYKAGRLPLRILTDKPEELDRFFAARGVSFPTRVFDLRMMRYRLLGGSVLNPDGRKRALFVYAGPENKILACEMYEGDVRRLPKDGLPRSHAGVAFFVYRRGSSTQVFWQEGATACVLVSDIPTEEVVQLAFAKATKV